MPKQKKRLKRLPTPLVPAHVDLRDVPIPTEVFIELAMEHFGVSREKAERLISETLIKTGKIKH